MSIINSFLDYLRFVKALYLGLSWNFTLKKISANYTNDSPKAKNQSKLVVYMADGQYIHGGLSDRLRGMASLFLWCKEHGVSFKIYHSSPFDLSTFLVPNTYDWRITSKELSFNKDNSRSIFIGSRLRSDGRIEKMVQKKLCDYLLSKDCKQFHVYTNMHFGDSQFSELYNELFKPSDILYKLLDEQMRLLGSDYIAIVFRFQQLLGDFKEADYPMLNEEAKEVLIKKSLDMVKDMYNKYGKKILITSDSYTFLGEVSNYGFVYVYKHPVVHVDYTLSASTDSYMKSFIDLYMLSNASKIFLGISGKMYHSGFAKRAAMIHNIPYAEISY